MYFKGRKSVDYGSGPYKITFIAGSTHASFNVPLFDDNIFESNETFILTIEPASLSGTVAVGDPGQATVIIMQNDGR